MGKLIEELCVVNANPAQHHGAKLNPDHIDIRPRATFDPLLETGATGATCRSAGWRRLGGALWCAKIGRWLRLLAVPAGADTGRVRRG